MSKSTHTVWEALNEPVMYISEDQAKKIFLASFVIIAAAWIAPQWGSVAQAATFARESQDNIFEQMAYAGEQAGLVAGASISITDEQGNVAEYITVPQWYYVVEGLPGAVVQTFSAGASEVLDISEPVGNLVEFYEPGVTEVRDAWLNLVRDPGTPEF